MGIARAPPYSIVSTAHAAIAKPGAYCASDTVQREDEDMMKRRVFVAIALFAVALLAFTALGKVVEFQQGPDVVVAKGEPQPGDDRGVDVAKGEPQPGDDRGHDAIDVAKGEPQPGDDRGHDRVDLDKGEPQPGDDRGHDRVDLDKGEPQPGDDRGHDRVDLDKGEPQPGDDRGAA